MPPLNIPPYDAWLGHTSWHLGCSHTGFPLFTSSKHMALLAEVRASGERGYGTPTDLLYASFCFVVFKLFRIPVNQWSLATAVVGGIVGIALLLRRELQSSFQQQCAHLFFGDAGVCRSAGKSD